MKTFLILILSVFFLNNIASAQSVKKIEYTNLYHFLNDTIVVGTGELNMETFSYNIILGNILNGQKHILKYKGEALSTLQSPAYITSQGSYFLINAATNSHKILKYLPDGSMDTFFGKAGESDVVFPTTSDVGILSLVKSNQNELYVYGDFMGEEGFRKVFVIKYLPNGKPDHTFGNNGTVVIGNDPKILGIAGVLIFDDAVVVITDYAVKVEKEVKVHRNLQKLDKAGNIISHVINAEPQIQTMDNDNHQLYLFCRHKVVVLDKDLKEIKQYEMIENSIMSRAIKGDGLNKNLIIGNKGVILQPSFSSVIYQLNDKATVYYEPVLENLNLFVVDYCIVNGELKILLASDKPYEEFVYQYFYTICPIK